MEQSTTFSINTQHFTYEFLWSVYGFVWQGKEFQLSAVLLGILIYLLMRGMYDVMNNFLWICQFVKLLYYCRERLESVILSIQISASQNHRIDLPEPVSMTFNIGKVCRNLQTVMEYVKVTMYSGMLILKKLIL